MDVGDWDGDDCFARGLRCEAECHRSRRQCLIRGDFILNLFDLSPYRYSRLKDVKGLKVLQALLLRYLSPFIDSITSLELVLHCILPLSTAHRVSTRHTQPQSPKVIPMREEQLPELIPRRNTPRLVYDIVDFVLN